MKDKVNQITENIKQKIGKQKVEKIKNIFEKTNTEKANKIFNTIIFIIYILITFVTTTKHEAWTDEAQAWLIARDLSISEIWSQMQNEGHSCLWHLILLPFAKLGLPFEIIKYISWSILVVSVFLILKFSPFNKTTKMLIIFSGPFLYSYSCISREYSLIPLMICLISIVYPKKKEHPYIYGLLLAIICNIHVVMIPFAGMLTLAFYGEELIIKRKENNKEIRKKLWIGAIIVFIGFMIFLLQIYEVFVNNAAITRYIESHGTSGIGDILSNIKGTVIKYIEQITQYQITLFSAISFILITVLLIINGKYYKKQALIFFPVIICNILLHAFLWFLIEFRAYLVLILIMFWAWNYKSDKVKVSSKLIDRGAIFALMIICAISIKGGIVNVKKDIKGQYSGGYEAAQYIENNIKEGSIFLTTQTVNLISPIIVYLDKEDYQFYSVKEDRFFTYQIWDKAWSNELDMKKINILLNHKFKGKKNIYLMTSIYYSSEEEQGFLKNYDEIYASNKVYGNYAKTEAYKIYKIPNIEYDN